MSRCLLTEAGRRTLYVEHDLDGLLRGDVKSRFDAYRLGRECGVYSPNDIRRKKTSHRSAPKEMLITFQPIGCPLEENVLQRTPKFKKWSLTKNRFLEPGDHYREIYA
jgi:hypothetical protein